MFAQFLNAKGDIVFTDFGIVISVNCEQPEKADSEIDCRFWLNMTELKLSQPEKVLFIKVTISSGITMLFKLLHELKALSPRACRPSDSSIDSRLIQPTKVLLVDYQYYTL